MSVTTRRVLIAVCALVIALGALSCTKQETTGLQTPTYYSSEVMSQVRDQINAGYEILETGNVDSAVAEFAKVSDLVQTGVVREYHTACAYARMGNADEAFNWLNKLVANGFDEPDRLSYDQDFASIQDDPRMETVLQKAAANAEAFDAVLAGGMPEYAEPPQAFASEGEFQSWYDEQRQLMRSNGLAWTSAQYRSAMIDLSARKLAALRALKADDPEFDYGLARVQEASSSVSLYEPWGAVTDLIMSEYNKYLQGSPTGANLSEVNYRAGLAQAMRYGADNPQRLTGYAEANSYLEKVAEDSEYYGAAQTLMILNRLRTPDADEAVVGPELMAAVQKYGEDPIAYRIISTQYGANTVSYIWPVAIEKPDIDNKQVKLSQYKGKALLIDFWATWCGPCRAELPNLLEQYKEYHPKGFEVLSISLDFESRLTLDDYRAWIKEQGMNWRHIYDGQGWDTPLVKDYFVSSIPAPFMVGADGSLVAWGEDCRGEALKGSIEKALGI